MFASPSPKQYQVNRSSSQGLLENSQSPNRSDCTRKKIQEKIIKNYMAKYNLTQPNEKIMNEVNLLFSKSTLTNNDLKALDTNVANIFTIRQSTNFNNADNLSLNRNNNIYSENKTLNEIVKLPNILNTKRRDEMSESKASGMSGCSELSNKYDLPNYKKSQLEKLLNDYNIRKEQGNSYDNMKMNEHIKTYDDKREQKNELKRQLDTQVLDKLKRDEELKRSSREFDMKLLKSINSYENTEKEKEKYRKIRNLEVKQSMDQIIKQEKRRIALQEKKEKELDEETIKKILEAIKTEELKELEKKQRQKENYNELLLEIENKKRREKELMEKEKEFEEKCFRDSEKISDKKDYSRYMELTNKGNNPNIKYEKLRKETFKESSKADRQRSVTVVSDELSSENKQDGDETLLKKIQEINLKKYDELEKKIKMLEEKLEYKNREENSNTNRLRINRIPNNYNQLNKTSVKKAHSQIKRKEIENHSSVLSNTGNKTLIINNLKESIPKVKPISSSLFTTQIGN